MIYFINRFALLVDSVLELLLSLGLISYSPTHLCEYKCAKISVPVLFCQGEIACTCKPLFHIG